MDNKVIKNKIITRVIAAILTGSLVLTAIGLGANDNNKTSGKWIDWTGNGDWCYQYSDGHWAANEYIDNYWINSSGWYDSTWNGKWDSNSTGWWYSSGSWYPCDAWFKIDGEWYYFKTDGYMAANTWIGNYYLTGSGTMATNTWIGEYYVGADGAWIPGYSEQKTTEQKTTEQKTTEQKTTEQKTTEQKTTEQKTTETKTTEQKSTETKTTEQKTEEQQSTTTTTKVYTVFDPHFHCEFESETIAKTANGGDDYSKGWYNYNYIVCNSCGKKYSSYNEYRNNDTCSIITFTDNDKEYAPSDNGWEEMSAYDYYFDYCQKYMGCVEYQYKAQVICHCGAQFDSYDDWNEHSKKTNHMGWSILDGTWGVTSQCLTYQQNHYPELISVTEQ